MINLIIDEEKCVQCKACALECPTLVINAKTSFPTIKEGKEDQCIKCQHCLAVCPTGALSIWGKNPLDSVPVTHDIPSGEQMKQLIKTRRSIRRFKKKALDKALIHKLVETAAYAPSSQNQNKVLFTLVDSKSQLGKFRELTYASLRKADEEGRIPERFAFASKFQSMWFAKKVDILFRDAPHMIVSSLPSTAIDPIANGSIALSYFELLANSYGIGTLWNGFLCWVIRDILPELSFKIGIPADHQIVEVMLFGKAAVRYSRSVQSEGLHLNLVNLDD